jgi:DNA-binding CsgD family transcriptional regulator
MIPDKSVLLEQINTVIRNSYKDSPDLPDLSLPGSYSSDKFSSELSNMRNSFLDKANRESFIKLEQRIEALEDQNNYLLYFIHFLYENFPDLVRNAAGRRAERNELVAGGMEVRTAHQPALTKREVEVLDLLVKGLCAKEIADSLYISETTVITHKKNLKKKYNVKNTVELISKAFIGKNAEVAF